MIKICANMAKKMPLPGIEFSSQQFGAAIEIEVAHGESPDVIRQRLQDLYNLLSATVDKQFESASLPEQSARRSLFESGGCKECQAHHGAKSSRAVSATAAQRRALFAICNSLDLDIAGVLADHNIADFAELSVHAASRLIDELKARRNGHSGPDQST